MVRQRTPAPDRPWAAARSGDAGSDQKTYPSSQYNSMKIRIVEMHPPPKRDAPYPAAPTRSSLPIVFPPAGSDWSPGTRQEGSRRRAKLCHGRGIDERSEAGSNGARGGSPGRFRGRTWSRPTGAVDG
jgi:hypothetical protein